jgi:ATP-dependent RNA helicase DDX3X
MHAPSINANTWTKTPSYPSSRNDGGYSRGGGNAGAGGRRVDGYGEWKNGQHVPGPPNPRTEKELFGDAEDPSKQHTGINFDRCKLILPSCCHRSSRMG